MNLRGYKCCGGKVCADLWDVDIDREKLLLYVTWLQIVIKDDAMCLCCCEVGHFKNA